MYTSLPEHPVKKKIINMHTVELTASTDLKTLSVYKKQILVQICRETSF